MKITKKQYIAIAAVIIFVARQYGLDETIGLGEGGLATLLDLISTALIASGIIDNSGE